MARYYLSLFSDLLETSPENSFVLPDPYDTNLDLKSNVKKCYCQIRWSIRMNDKVTGLIYAYYIGHMFEERLSSPSLRRSSRNVLSRHYLEACTRVYNLYKIVGIQQIYRTKRTSFWMFRKISQATYIQLYQDALSLL
jgi:hypothetical protein